MRLDEVEEQLGDTVRVEWKAFLLRPEPTGGDPEKHEKFVEYTKSWLRPAAAEPSLTFNVWATDNPQPGTKKVPGTFLALGLLNIG